MGVEYSLKQDGFQVSLAYRLEEARSLLKRTPFDLVLLDLGLPDGSGYQLCKEIRAAGDMPIIILSARDEEPVSSSASTWARTTTSPSPSACVS